MRFLISFLVLFLFHLPLSAELIVLKTGGYLVGEVTEEENTIKVASSARDSLIILNKKDIAYIDKQEDINSYLKSLKKKEPLWPVFEDTKPVLAVPEVARKQAELARRDVFISLKELIEGAEHEILCVVYNIEDPRIFGLFADARMRKVALYIAASRKGADANLHQLKNLGAEIHWLGDKQRTFAPFFIIDRTFLWMCPYGARQAHMLMSEASALVISHPPLVKQYLRLYNQAWTQTLDPYLKRTFGFLTGTAYMETLFTSGKSAYERLNEEIKAAANEIYILTPALEDAGFIKKLIERQKAGVDVKVVLTKGENLRKLKRLKKAGAEIVVSENFYTVDSTFIIIDGKFLITGSFLLDKVHKDNLTQNLIFVYNNVLAGFFRKEVERLF